MKHITLLLIALLFTGFSYAQVGIGTTDPDPSSMLDITSDSQGLLAPRMTTIERNNITDPAESLLVFDTDETAFYFYDKAGTKWVKLQANNVERDNYVLVKDESDFPAPTSGTITLASNTLYEINGSITLAYPIELNNAQLLGRDVGEDKLSKASGAVFTGTTGGNIKNLTITGGGTVFAITDGNMLLFQNCIVEGMASVGTISGVGLYFSNIVNFINNDTGITYENIGNLLLNNQGWLDDNRGTYEKLTGTFGLVEKVSGFSTVSASATGFDVSTNPSVGTGVLTGTVFSGAGTYVNRYGAGSYSGYNFTNDWTVNAPGIPRESDDVAGGNFYYDDALTTGFTQTITTNGAAVPINGNGTFTATNLFRFTAVSDNKLQYDGKKTRNFQINASISIRGEVKDEYYAFVIAVDGNVVTESNSIARISRSYNNGSNTYSYTIQNVAINSVVTVSPGQTVELYIERLTGSGNSDISVFSENLSIK